jgi:cell division protein FtsW
LVTIIYVAFWLSAKQDFIKDLKFGLIPLAIILGISAALILMQPDLSAAVTILIIGGIMFYLGGGEIRQIIPTLIVALIAGSILLMFYSTGKERIATYIAGLRDPSTASYHLIRSFEAVVHGGFFGVGIGRGSTKFTGLPVAPTDSIFSVIAEETGIFGASMVIVLYLVFLWRGLTIARNADDLLGRLLAAGITIWIFLEAFINMSVLVNLLPFAGNALPFISYGGSSLTMVMIGTGIVLNVGRMNAIKNNEEEGSPLNAVVNLRGDDRWRSVSRNRRPTSAGR